MGVIPGPVPRVVRKATARVIFRPIRGAICWSSLTVTWTEVCGLIQKATGKATAKATRSVTLMEVRTKTSSVTPHATCRGTLHVVLGAKCPGVW